MEGRSFWKNFKLKILQKKLISEWFISKSRTSHNIIFRERTQSQVEFFKMLDAKIEEGADYLSEEDWTTNKMLFLNSLCYTHTHPPPNIHTEWPCCHGDVVIRRDNNRTRSDTWEPSDLQIQAPRLVLIKFCCLGYYNVDVFFIWMVHWRLTKQCMLSVAIVIRKHLIY